MIDAYCPVCQKTTGHARRLGFGTLFMVLLTCGFGLLLLPLYPKRCTVCGRELPKLHRLRQDVPKAAPTSSSLSPLPSSSPTPDLSPGHKICPACAETIKLAALKCRFCGHSFDPDQVAQAVAALDASLKKAAGLTQCPACLKWDVHDAYLPDGGFGPWCPHCRRPLPPL
jgi:hypothetical protein